MSENANTLYEGLFLLNSATIGSDLNKGLAFVREILSRASADVEAILKWDDRRLAYEIEGQKRGLYLLAYFRVSGGQIPNIERDITLSEQALRCLILRADHIGEAELAIARQKAAETNDAASLAASKAADDQPAPAAVEAAEPVEVADSVDADTDDNGDSDN